MGSVAHLIIDGYPIFHTKNCFNEEVASHIFVPNDFIEYKRRAKERNKLIWGDSYKDDNSVETVSNFKSTVSICLERLEAYGVNSDKCKEEFNSAMTFVKEDQLCDFFNKSRITYEDYLKTISEIMATGYLERDNYDNSFKDYLVENDLMLEYQSDQYGLYSILSTRSPESVVEYDIDDLIKGLWTSDDPKEQITIKKIIIFTEGKTDTEFIKLGLAKFKPHLLDIYHFIDFEDSKYEANASRLVHTIKSFVGSGIDNLIIALFDNDSAGHKEINNLRQVKLPANIKVLTYPNIELLENYPAIGPTGLNRMNVNGLAGSIEMYFGVDCLSGEKGLIPIKWTNYVDAIDRYQGSIIEKVQVQKKFRSKMKMHLKESVRVANWIEMDLLLSTIINAFKHT
jgi:hypothetical protein